jgi:hypothetical protein
MLLVIELDRDIDILEAVQDPDPRSISRSAHERRGDEGGSEQKDDAGLCSHNVRPFL